jgi:hypothetical protein
MVLVGSFDAHRARFGLQQHTELRLDHEVEAVLGAFQLLCLPDRRESAGENPSLLGIEGGTTPQLPARRERSKSSSERFVAESETVDARLADERRGPPKGGPLREQRRVSAT